MLDRSKNCISIGAWHLSGYYANDFRKDGSEDEWLFACLIGLLKSSVYGTELDQGLKKNAGDPHFEDETSNPDHVKENSSC